MPTSQPFEWVKPRTMMIPVAAGLLMVAGTASAQPIRYPSEIKPSKRSAAEIAAYDALARVACSSCAGGFRDEGEPELMIADRLKALGHDMNTLLAGIAPQQGTAWSGREVFGMRTFVAEGSVASFPCKHFRYSISRGTQRAEKDRLLCLGERGPGSTAKEWITVY